MSKRSRTFAIWIGLIATVILILVVRDQAQRRDQAAREMMMTGLDELPENAELSDAYMELLSRQRPSTGLLQDLLPVLLIVIVVLAVLIFFVKRAGKQQGNIFELRKTRARQLKPEITTTFADVGGLDEAIDSLRDLVMYLRNPSAWTDAGTRSPRGILLTGPPGTGKTLLARALAGETDSAFFYTSATEFVEMFVGVGAARVRDTFENASKEKSAVIFIDELDAIGRQRSSGVGVMHEEREQTLNQLLVLMDGLERSQHVVVLAATNRADVLDPALVRPGRFDRMLHIKAPDSTGRLQILEIHCRDKPMADDVDLTELAAQTESFTGADLETLINEASITAIRRSAQEPGFPTSIHQDDIEQAQRRMQSSQSKFDRLDAVLVESVTQLAEPTGRAVARVTMVTGQVLEGDILWMNSTHIKLRDHHGKAAILSREHAAVIEALEGTETGTADDVAPDRWVRSQIDAR